MSVRNLHRIGLVGLLALALFSVMPGSSLLFGGASALLVVIVAGAPFLPRTERPRWLAPIVHLATVAGLVFALILFRRVTFDAIVLIVLLGIFNRYVLRGGQRDDLILTGASAVLLASGTLITPGLSYLLLLIGYLPAVIFALWASQILAGAERGPAERRVAAQLALERLPAPHGKLRLAFTMLTFSAIGYVTMAMFPRYHFVSWLSPGAFLNLGGAASSMELRTSGVRAPAEGAVVMRVLGNEKVGEVDLTGLYARVFVLDRFDGKSFSADDPKQGRAPVNRQRRTQPSSDRGSVTVMLERLASENYTYPIAALGRDRPARTRMYLEQSSSGTFWGRAPGNSTIMSYSVDLFEPHELSAPKPQNILRLLELPEGVDPRLVELAKTLTAGKTTTSEKVDAILVHFGRGYRYSLEPLEGEEDDPLVRFVLEAKQGHCELYAGAVTVLLRLAGVPARVATGYYGGYYSQLGGHLELTTADAHAWVELYDEERGWRWVDATPEGERVRRTKSFAWLSDWIEVLEMAWFEKVVDFDEIRRKRFVDDLSERFTAVGADLGDFQIGGPRGSGGLPALGLFGVFAIFAAAGAVVFVYRRRVLSPESLGEALRAALGERPEDNLTLGALALRVPATIAADARRAIRLYEALRFGPASEAPPPVEVRRAVLALRKAVHSGA